LCNQSQFGAIEQRREFAGNGLGIGLTRSGREYPKKHG